MRNSEKYKTAKEFDKAFEKYCKSKNCVKCNLSPTERVPCLLDWLELESEEEKPMPCPFCGSKTVITSYDKVRYCIECTECNYRSEDNYQEEGAIAAHNRVAKAVMESGK